MGRRHCRTCQSDGLHRLELPQHPELQPLEACQFGDLYRCSRCSCFWFAHEHHYQVRRLHDEWLPVAEHWKQSKFSIDAGLAWELGNIGGTNNGFRHSIEVPCRIRNSSGQIHEKALVSISRMPLNAHDHPQKVHWANEIVEITPSAFAVPLDVRQASARKQEVALGYAPVAVEDTQGRRYRLGSESAFFDFRGVTGADLKLAEDQSDCQRGEITIEYGLAAMISTLVYKKTLSLVTGRKQSLMVWPKEPDAIYCVNWFEGCEMLLRQSPAPALQPL